MEKREKEIRADALVRYFDIMNLAISSQSLLNTFLSERYPSVDWSKYHKNEIAIRYAIGEFLTKDDIHALYNHFGSKRLFIDITAMLKRINNE